MLLNLSNHPSSNWPAEQTTAATKRYGSIEDLPFPNVPPEATSDQVRQLAEQFYNKIRKMDPQAIHIMGEMTFTFALVNMLMAVGYPCLASTTNRIVEERDGKKIVQFEFLQFRSY